MEVVSAEELQEWLYRAVKERDMAIRALKVVRAALKVNASEKALGKAERCLRKLHA